MDDAPGVLGSGALRKTLDQLDAADQVVVDAPAVDESIDAVVIASQCDAAILVVDAQRGRRRAIENAVSQLSQANVELLGVVLNRVEADSGRGRRAGSAVKTPSPRGEPGAARVAIVHERFTEWAGSERVVEQLHALLARRPIHAAVVDRSVLPATLRDADVRPTGLQRLYRGGTQYSHLLPLLPARSGTSTCGASTSCSRATTRSHRVALQKPSRSSRTPTPRARWLWDPAERAAGEVGGAAAKAALSLFAATQRGPDRAAGSRLPWRDRELDLRRRQGARELGAHRRGRAAARRRHVAHAER